MNSITTTRTTTAGGRTGEVVCGPTGEVPANGAPKSPAAPPKGLISRALVAHDDFLKALAEEQSKRQESRRRELASGMNCLVSTLGHPKDSVPFTYRGAPGEVPDGPTGEVLEVRAVIEGFTFRYCERRVHYGYQHFYDIVDICPDCGGERFYNIEAHSDGALLSIGRYLRNDLPTCHKCLRPEDREDYVPPTPSLVARAQKWFISWWPFGRAAIARSAARRRDAATRLAEALRELLDNQEYQ